MSEQITLFNIDTECMDETISKNGKKSKPPKWMQYKRCENCTRWNRFDKSEQPPDGWGIYGYCAEHIQKTGACSYCDKWEDIRRLNE